MADASTTFSIMHSWIEKGNNTDNVFDQFIAYWIAFNCFYWTNTKDTTTGDSACVKEIGECTRVKQIFNDIVSDSANKGMLEEIIRVSPVKNMKTGETIHAKISEVTYEKLVHEFIYQVRNNLFHGSKGGDVIRDKEVTSACVPFLQQFTKKLHDAQEIWKV